MHLIGIESCAASRLRGFGEFPPFLGNANLPDLNREFPVPRRLADACHRPHGRRVPRVSRRPPPVTASGDWRSSSLHNPSALRQGPSRGPAPRGTGESYAMTRPATTAARTIQPKWRLDLNLARQSVGSSVFTVAACQARWTAAAARRAKKGQERLAR